jgi:predicted nucleic acid-binding protein
LVLDAGPLIALFHALDPDHAMAVAGFGELQRAGTDLLAPLPVVFEVYKWLAYRTRPALARAGLERMQETIEFVYPKEDDLNEVVSVLDSMPTWPGSLEDALVAVTALWYDVPVWTLNYRDLGAFRNLHFWTPASA